MTCSHTFYSLLSLNQTGNCTPLCNGEKLTVVLWVVGEDRSRHSPNKMEAANITTVVTMATSRLSSTLKWKKVFKIRNKTRLCLSAGADCDGSPEEPGLRVNIFHAILGQTLVHAVEERPQQATDHTHQDEEGQVHCGPQVAVLIAV